MGFFTGKTAIVTGAGSGIGKALALALADEGARVVITDIDETRMLEVVEEIERKGADAGAYRVDHSRREDVEEFAKRFKDEWGRVDVLCSNAGVGCGGRLEETTLEDWEWVLGVNLWGAIYMMHYFVPAMKEQGGGSVLITASDAGLFSIPGMLAYQASKHGVMGLATTLRVELSNHNINVGMLCPGIINTNIISDGRINLLDDSGRCTKDELVNFYRKRGVDPSVVAEAGLRAIERDKGIVLVPWAHSGPQYVLWRISPALYFAAFRFLWKRGVLHKIFGIQQ
jgi:NAD(P)-dependent dehydrogenase (short-subunit alcohol dehydrogenase family)